VDAYLTPINRRGTAMYPTPELVLDAVRQTRVPVLAIKPMAGGRYLGAKAFEYVFHEVGVDGCMFGMGTIEQVRETATAAREVLGIA
jgi:aryl-alcohol dehydrogenase-like predicted oxidoreductase